MITFAPALATTSAMPLRAAESLAPSVFSSIRKRAILDGCKWDPQVGDVDTLAPFPLVLKSSEWRKISRLAEQLTAEAIAAEQEIAADPALVRQLGLPRGLSSILAAKTPLSPAGCRVVRFDFHYTTDGWKISEANSDVPGGFSEASHFTALVSEHFPEYSPAGDPAAAWADALCHDAAPSGSVALLSAPGYMEDHQVVSFLAAQLRVRHRDTILIQPNQIIWRHGIAHLDNANGLHSLAAIVRFYQAEWLARFPQKSGWSHFFRGGKTPVANPPLAVIWESKRFPLVWDRLLAHLPTWRDLLPETRDPRCAPWPRDDSWLLKTAMCNTGDTVSIREFMNPRDWLQTALRARLFPNRWLAQRRFRSVLLATPAGPRHACIGVYTVNGRAAGAYARLSPGPVIDFAATDAALLLD